MVVAVTQMTQVLQLRLLQRRRDRHHRGPLIHTGLLRRRDDRLHVPHLLIVQVDMRLTRRSTMRQQLAGVRLLSLHRSDRSGRHRGGVSERGHRTGDQTTGDSQTSNTQHALTQHRVHDKAPIGGHAHTQGGTGTRTQAPQQAPKRRGGKKKGETFSISTRHAGRGIAASRRRNHVQRPTARHHSRQHTPTMAGRRPRPFRDMQRPPLRRHSRRHGRGRRPFTRLQRPRPAPHSTPSQPPHPLRTAPTGHPDRHRPPRPHHHTTIHKPRTPSRTRPKPHTRHTDAEPTHNNRGAARRARRRDQA